MSTLKNLDVLVINARQLNEDALLALYDSYLPHVFRFIYYHVDNRSIAENLTTKTFLKMLATISEFRGDGKSFYPWLLRIAGDLTFEHLKSKSDESQVFLEGIVDIFRDAQDKGSIRRKNISMLDAADIKKAVGKLADEEKQVLVLKLAMGLSNTEITEVLDISEGFIKSLQVKSLIALRRILEGRSAISERVEPTIGRNDKTMKKA